MQLCLSRPQLLVILFLSFFVFAQPSFAGRVVKVSGKKIFIKLNADEVEQAQTGGKVYITTKDGKKKGIAVIRKMKGRNVIAQLKKGKAAKGLYTSADGAAAPTAAAATESTESASMEEASEVAENESANDSKSDLQFGLMFGYNSTGQDVVGIANMTGSSIAVKGILDYSLFDRLGVRGRVGMDMMSVAATAGDVTYETSINYLALDLLLRYNLVQSSSFHLFANGGLGIYSPMSSELTGGALKEDSISTTSILIVGLGIALPMGSWTLFGGLEYFYFPPSDTVTTSSVGGNLGILF